ncbi:MAG: DUF2079 domain-containing protein [Candidatus Omnitrophota bacterium]
MISSRAFNFWNGIATFAAILALFFLLTSGVPLVQLGWLSAFSGKSAYQNMAQVPVSAFFCVFFLLYFKHRDLFSRLSVVCFVRAVLKTPLTVLLLILTLTYIAIMSSVSILRHFSGAGGDVAIFAQAIWNGAQGDFLYSSIKDGICLLGDHMSPILAFVIPFYRLWPDPILVFILQAVAIGSGVYFTGWLAREKLKSDYLAIVFSVIYFFYFNARVTLHYEFHPEALVEPFMFLAFICAERKRLAGFLACLFIVALGKENMLGISFMMGFYVFAFNSWKRVGIWVMALSVIIFLLEVKWLMPFLNRSPYQYNYYGHPGLSLWKSLEYLLKIYSPVLFLPFFHPPTLLLTLPIVFQNMFSANDIMRIPSRHYTIGLHPFLFISAIYGFGVLCMRWPAFAKRKNIAICIVLWFSLLRSGPSEYFYAWNFIKEKRPYDMEMLAKIQGIGPKYSVLTQANFLTRLINRKDLYVLDGRTPPTREMIEKYQFDYILFSRSGWPLSDMPFAETLENLKAWGYRISFEKDGFYILVRSEVAAA